MRSLRLALLLLLLTPAIAHAEGVSVITREVPLGAERTLAGSATPFTMVGVHWRGSGAVSFRTRSVSGRWSPWRPAAPEDDAPDAGTRERAATRGWRVGNPWWTGPSNRIEYRLSGDVRRLRAHFVWSQATAVPARTTAAAGQPALINRLGWSANEQIKRAAPRYADTLRFSIVHHTAGTNTYARDESAAIVRGIQAYHVKSNGWNDIGYNFLVDRFGQVFEGRAGGIERNVIGAHAEGFNTGSVGVAVIGNYGGTGISAAARKALVETLAWRLDVAHLDPATTLSVLSGGNGRFPAGIPVFLRAVSGHRDTGFTSCPGNTLYAELNAISGSVQQTGGPKLFEPLVRGSVGGKVRFTARVSAAVPWTVTVRDALGQVAASGTGTGPVLDWTWDAATARGAYTYSLDVVGARPAKGSIAGAGAGGGGGGGGTVLQPLLGPIGVEPATVTPNADGLDDTTTISYTLGADAWVTATLVDPAGTVKATLFSERKTAGKQSFLLTAESVADGRYRIVLSVLADDGTNVAAETPLIVSRLLRGFVAEPALFSPNADGRLDSVALTFELAGPAEVALRVLKGKAWVATIFTGQLAPGPQSITWDGAKRDGRLLDGRYVVELTVSDPVASVAQTIPLEADSTPPKLSLVSLKPLRLRLSEDATVSLTVNGKRLLTSETAGVFSVPFAGSARRVRGVAVDAAENVSRVLAVPAAGR